MNRNEIEKFCEAHNSTVLNFPDRGPWGNNKYRGNCSGWTIAYLIWRYGVTSLAELFAGGGTGSDVCKDMGIPYIGADLNPNPVRNNILTVNAVTDEVPDEFRNADMIFMHPPYGAEINIPYAGSMYKDPTGELSSSDLGQMPWKQFMRTLNEIVMKYYSAMAPGSKMAILMGDVRRKGFGYMSMYKDIVKPGEVLQTYIKMQNNCVSDGRTYSNKFTPIDHEMMLVLQKVLDAYFINFQWPQDKKMDIRDSKSATWKDVVYAAMRKLKKADLDSIYAEIDGHEKCQMNENWKAKVRQVLQQGKFKNVERGVWELAA